MEKQLLQVREFQAAFGVEMPNKPKMLGKKRARLRQTLLQEEVTELAEAKDLVDVADALADILYITYGTIHEYGLADRAVMLFDEVHRSNMSKLDFDGKPIFREDGKIMKPETYLPPKIKPILERDFTVYKESEVMKEIAKIEKSATEMRIIKKIYNKLNLFDRLLFWLYNKTEAKLKDKIEVKFPKTIDGNIVVRVYHREYGV